MFLGAMAFLVALCVGSDQLGRIVERRQAFIEYQRLYQRLELISQDYALRTYCTFLGLY